MPTEGKTLMVFFNELVKLKEKYSLTDVDMENIMAAYRLVIEEDNELNKKFADDIYQLITR